MNEAAGCGHLLAGKTPVFSCLSSALPQPGGLSRGKSLWGHGGGALGRAGEGCTRAPGLAAASQLLPTQVTLAEMSPTLPSG